MKYAQLKEVKEFLNGLQITYVCGPSYFDSRRGTRVPIAIHESKWQSCFAKSEARRKKLIAKMSELGIETSIIRPDDDDDDDDDG